MPAYSLMLPRPLARPSSRPALWMATLLLCATAVSSAWGQGGWFVQPSPATTNLYHVDFLTPQVGWVSGEEGAIIKTTDGGDDWFAQNSGTTYGMRGISFGSASVGIAVGAGGTIIRTTDGGNTWITVRTGYIDSFFNVEMVDDHFGCAVGANGIHRAWAGVTTDGGVRWSFHDWLINNTECSLSDVHFFDNQNGLVAAYVQGGTGAIYKTTNGGSAWVQVVTVPFGLFAISFPTPQIGWVSGVNGRTLHTTDGGVTWTQGSSYNFTQYGNSFPTVDSGWTVGANGSILHTSDGGGTWEWQTSGFYVTLNSIQMLDQWNGFVAGDNGLLLRTISGGGPESAVAGGGAGPAALRLLPNQPNPFAASTLVRFDTPSAGPVRLQIFDLLGREVRSVRLEQAAPGVRSWTWDGRDASGRPAAAGAYQCRIRDDLGHRAERLILRVRG